MIPDTRIIDPREIPDSAIAWLRDCVVKSILPEAPVFATWLHNWLDTEAYWRRTDPPNRPKRHLQALPPAAEWSDKDLGLALKAAAKLSYIEMDASLSDLVDRLALCLSEAAGNLLIGHATG